MSDQLNYKELLPINNKKNNKPLATDQIIDQLLSEYDGTNPDLVFGDKGLFKELQKRLLERMLNSELNYHLGHNKNQKSLAGNYRNGSSTKSIVTENNGAIEVEIPRDRNGNFEPIIIPKHQRRFKGFDDKIIALYARGMTTTDIKDHLEEAYDVEISESLISSVTNDVMEEVIMWQNRPLDKLYPIIFLDCLIVKARENNQVSNKAVYIALGINLEGKKEILGIWISKNEGAKFWLNILTELKNRGIEDIFVACVDGLKGFPEAINSVFPNTQIQLCIVHMVRNSLNYVPVKDKKFVATDLKTIYQAKTEEQARQALVEFKNKWDDKYPTISDSWNRNWAEIIPFLSYPEDIRKAIYTTNSIESVNFTLRKIIKNKQLFPNDDSIRKILYLALRNISKKWTMPIKNWKLALNQFAILFPERFPEKLNF
jgi:putative transposase